AQYGFPFSPSFTPTRWQEEGETLKVGNHSFQFLHIPGHTPGQVVFYNTENRLLVAGDFLFYETLGRTYFTRGKNDDLI
ncbi:MBL fold metallo-hydrolase, partial [Neisseria sp. P0015.S009]|uniref:MBL fold metallo-hydrolase n=1 Tax=Neisseria sp. P0015.S009 TaxID=3436765 RepID=UPI003F7F8126